MKSKFSIFHIPYSIYFPFKNLKSKWQMVNGKWQIPKGFTLIELIAVFAVLGIVSSFGIASFSSFNNQQILQSGASDIKNMLQVARTRAFSQVKPQQCADETLSGYQVAINTVTSQYSLIVVCDTAYVLETKKLSSDITFRSDSTGTIFFQVLTGNPSLPASIILTGYGKSAVIQVDAAGTVRLEN
jgi:prepilin-type N-terminal cleavage/methylation domain-containing protein